MKGVQSFIHLLFELSLWVCLLAVGLIVVTTVSINMHFSGGYSSFLIQSGSMEPAIMTGDIIVIQKQNEYRKTDVITFRTNENRIVTHRIVAEENNGTTFVTKGDANRSEDNDIVKQDQIIGKVAAVIPKLGYFVGFSKSPFGFILLIIFPATAMIIDQLLKMMHAKS